MWLSLPGEKAAWGWRAHASRGQRFPGLLWPDSSDLLPWAGPGCGLLAGNLKLRLEYFLVPEWPRENGPWDDASTLQPDQFRFFPNFWPVPDSRQRRAISEYLNMKKVRIAVKISGSSEICILVRAPPPDRCNLLEHIS